VTVIVTPALALSLVPVIVTEPGATAVTTPPVETVAMPAFDDDHDTVRPESTASDAS